MVVDCIKIVLPFCGSVGRSQEERREWRASGVCGSFISSAFIRFPFPSTLPFSFTAPFVLVNPYFFQQYSFVSECCFVFLFTCQLILTSSFINMHLKLDWQWRYVLILPHSNEHQQNIHTGLVIRIISMQIHRFSYINNFFLSCSIKWKLCFLFHVTSLFAKKTAVQISLGEYTPTFFFLIATCIS